MKIIILNNYLIKKNFAAVMKNFFFNLKFFKKTLKIQKNA